MNSTRFPYSIDDVKEGLLPLPWVLEACRAIGGIPGDRFSLLDLKRHLEQTLLESGRPAIVKISGETLEVLPPDRGDQHMEKEGRRSLRYFIRTHQRRLSSVDAGRLTDDQRAARTRSLALNAMKISALAGCRRLPAEDKPKGIEHKAGE